MAARSSDSSADCSGDVMPDGRLWAVSIGTCRAFCCFFIWSRLSLTAIRWIQGRKGRSVSKRFMERNSSINTCWVTSSACSWLCTMPAAKDGPVMKIEKNPQSIEFARVTPENRRLLIQRPVSSRGSIQPFPITTILSCREKGSFCGNFFGTGLTGRDGRPPDFQNYRLTASAPNHLDESGIDRKAPVTNSGKNSVVSASKLPDFFGRYDQCTRYNVGSLRMEVEPHGIRDENPNRGAENDSEDATQAKPAGSPKRLED